MKSLDELDISPLPWKLREGHSDVISGRSFVVSNAYDTKENMANAHLIKTAPKLYQAIYDAYCRRCEVCDLREPDGSCNQPESDCVVQQWKQILAEAAGEVK